MDRENDCTCSKIIYWKISESKNNHVSVMNELIVNKKCISTIKYVVYEREKILFFLDKI